MNYSEKLRDPRWQRKRLEILQRDRFACIECLQDQMELHVHHLRYISKRDPWDYPDHLLATLCSDCHDRVHGGEALGYELLIPALSGRGCSGVIAYCFAKLLDEALPAGDALGFEEWKQVYRALEDAIHARAKSMEKSDA